MQTPVVEASHYTNTEIDLHVEREQERDVNIIKAETHMNINIQ